MQHGDPHDETISETAKENQTAPDPIAEMTSADSHHLIILEKLDSHSKSKTYGKSMRVVSRVKGIKPNDNDVVLDHLTTDQVCLFARNIGVPNMRSKNKFVCHLAMASHFEFHYQLSSFVCLPLHMQTKQQQMFAGLSMSFLAINS